MSSQRYLGTSQLTCQRSKLCLGYERHENVHGEGTFQGVRAIFHGRHARTPDRGRVLVFGQGSPCDGINRAPAHVMRPLAPALPGADTMTSPRLVLRDGSAASVRPAMPADVAALRRFFESLSAVSRYQRFLTAGEPPDAVIARLSDSTDPSRALTFVVERAGGPAGPGLRIIATASYIAITDDTAEVAFAVADDFQGKGLGTALLERLAVAASSHGFHRFQATTLEHNTGMLEVFRDSGFEIRSKSAEGCIDVQLSLEASAAGVAAEEERNRLATAASIYPLLAPRAVAVIGASRNPSNIGRRVLDAHRGHRLHGTDLRRQPACHLTWRRLPAVPIGAGTARASTSRSSPCPPRRCPASWTTAQPPACNRSW